MPNIPSLDKDSFFELVPVTAYRKDNDEYIDTYPSTIAAARAHGIRPGTVYDSTRSATNPKGSTSRKLKTKVYFKLTNNQDK